MKLLSISTDKKILDSGSNVQKRFMEYGKTFDNIFVILLTNSKYDSKNFENIHVIPTNSKNKLFSVLDAIKIGLNINNIDYILTQDPFETGLVGLFLKERKNTKLNVQIHTDIYSKYFYRTPLNFIRKIISKIVLPASDVIRVVSKKVSSILEKKYPNKKIILLPITTSDNVKEYGNVDLHQIYGNDKKIFLTVGRLEKEKNLFSLISAFKKIVKLNDKAILVIVGEGSLKDKLIKSIEKNNLENNIFIHKFTQEISDYYKTADYLIHTSLYEGYGMVITEAILSNLVTITTNVGVSFDYLKDNESFIKIGYKNYSIFDGIKKALDLSEEEYKKISDNAYKKISDNIISIDYYYRGFKEMFLNE
jgi:glycosyltransferase involved in cell wall biosynthesis